MLSGSKQPSSLPVNLSFTLQKEKGNIRASNESQATNRLNPESRSELRRARRIGSKFGRCGESKLLWASPGDMASPSIPPISANNR